MHVSVVIPTYNRAALLRRTIPVLTAQDAPGVSYEVIFVSNGSTDDTAAVLAAAAARYPERFRYFVIAPTGGPSAPRNRGIREARGDVVVILDDDVLPDPDLVQAHAAFHRAHPDLHCAAVGELRVSPDSLSDPMSLFHTFPYDEVRRLPRLSYLHFWTCNVSFKRHFMLTSGMFDETFLYYEDVLCGYRLERNGMQLHFLPEARGEHLHQLKPEGVAAKGLFTGLWLQAFIEQVPDPAARERFGILASGMRPRLVLRRVLGRVAFWLIDNPLTVALLRLLGAAGPRRTPVTDAYYRLIFRRNLMLGLKQARSAARGRAAKAGPALAWVDRGES